MIDIPPIPDKEYFSIGEASQLVQVQPYVLRYWESEFRLLRPSRRTSGQRKYTRKDIELIFQIKELLHAKKYTIAGAKKLLLGDKRRKDAESHQLNMEIKTAGFDPRAIIEAKEELEDILKVLRKDIE